MPHPRNTDREGCHGMLVIAVARLDTMDAMLHVLLEGKQRKRIWG